MLNTRGCLGPRGRAPARLLALRGVEQSGAAPLLPAPMPLAEGEMHFPGDIAPSLKAAEAELVGASS